MERSSVLKGKVNVFLQNGNHESEQMRESVIEKIVFALLDGNFVFA